VPFDIRLKLGALEQRPRRNTERGGDLEQDRKHHVELPRSIAL
jgi:hypothetical protein